MAAAAAKVTPNLPFGDVNLVVLTDVHSWVGGHPSEPSLDASYGEVLSFYEHIQRYCEDNDQDVWLVQNGDWLDGTGLSMDGDPSSLLPLIEKMPFDVVNTGNHEMYRAPVIDYMTRPGGYIDWWGDRYLASNIYLTDTNSNRRQRPLGNQYTVLQGKHSKILVFGFLYDMVGASDKVTVQNVEEAVQKRWFHKALTETKDYNAIVVMAHAGHDDPSVTAIHQTIRKIIKDDTMPIQFIAGHTHVRGYSVLDPLSTAVEAGRYLDTVGWVSFANKDTVEARQRKRLLQNNNATAESGASPTPDEPEPTIDMTPDPFVPSITVDDSFQHVFLDGNVDTLQQTLGISSRDDFDTEDGKELTEFIQLTRKKMGLDKRIGCAPRDYILFTTMDNENSLWRLFAEEVVPRELIKDSSVKRAMFLSQGSWRYDLVGGSGLTYDDVIAVSPFDDPIYLIGTVPGDIVTKLNVAMNGNAEAENRYYAPLPAWILADNCVSDQDCELYSRGNDIPSFKATLQKLYPDLGEPVLKNMTATTIWLSFVINNWHCFEGVFDNQWWSQEAHQALEEGKKNKMAAGAIVFIALLVAVGLGALLMFAWRKVTRGTIQIGVRNQYGEMMTSLQRAKEMDEADAEVGSEDEDEDEDDSATRIV